MHVVCMSNTSSNDGIDDEDGEVRARQTFKCQNKARK